MRGAGPPPATNSSFSGGAKTGSRVAERLSAHGISMRAAARSGADVHFDWDDQATWEEALRGATGLYVVSPVLRIDFAGLVARFLDRAERAGVRHVTYLSAYGMEQAPADVAPRAVESGRLRIVTARLIETFQVGMKRQDSGDRGVRC